MNSAGSCLIGGREAGSALPDRVNKPCITIVPPKPAIAPRTTRCGNGRSLRGRRIVEVYPERSEEPGGFAHKRARCFASLRMKLSNHFANSLGRRGEESSSANTRHRFSGLL